jgi:hypothetical protein
MNDGALRAVKKLYIRLCAARDTTEEAFANDSKMLNRRSTRVVPAYQGVRLGIVRRSMTLHVVPLKNPKIHQYLCAEWQLGS